jgi:hypothetical protein
LRQPQRRADDCAIVTHSHSDTCTYSGAYPYNDCPNIAYLNADANPRSNDYLNTRTYPSAYGIPGSKSWPNSHSNPNS